MRAKSLTVGLSLAAAGVVTPLAALAQAPAAPAPAAPAPAAPAPAAPAPAAPAPEAPAPAAAPTEPAAAAPAPAPAAPEAAPAPAADAAAPAPAPATEPAPADAPPPLAVVTGYVEGAYHANFDKYSYDVPVPLRSYDSLSGNSFLLHAAHIGVAHSFGPEASAFISLDFGSDARFNNFNYAPATVVSVPGTPGDPNATPPVPPTPASAIVLPGPSNLPVDVREAFGQWTPGDFMLKAGKFVTLNGIEVVDGPLNPTITRGFLFGLAEPVTHTGVKAQYALGGIAHIGAGIVNGWDNIVDNNNAKTILFNADIAPAPIFRAQVSGSYGSEQVNVDDAGRLTLDLTGAFILDSLTLNFQGLVGSEKNVIDTNADTVLDSSDSWFGFGLQPVYTMDMFSIGGRVEYFNNKHGSRTGLGDDSSLLNFTITPGITPAKNFTLRAEYRIDAVLGATGPDPANPKNVLNGKSSQNTIAIGAHYAF